MVMQGINPYTGTDRPPTAEEAAVLRKIAMFRAAGYSDDEIYSGGLAQTFDIPTGYEYLPFIGNMAGVRSSFDLGRGSLALGAADLGYQMQANPYNVVSALQYGRDTGASNVLTDPTLSNVPQSPMAGYLGFIDNLLSEDRAGGAVGAASSADLAAVQRVRDEVGDEQALAGFGRLAALPAAPAAPAPTATTAAYNPLATQQAAARRGGSSGLAGAAQGEEALRMGAIPGNAAFSERQFGLFTPDQRANVFGLQASTGRVSDPVAAYQNYARLYGHRGATAGRTYR